MDKIMPQLDLELSPSVCEFINNHQQFGFQDRNRMVETAMQKLKRELEQVDLTQSAILYAEIYKQDKELQELTDSAIQGWPE